MVIAANGRSVILQGWCYERGRTAVFVCRTFNGKMLAFRFWYNAKMVKAPLAEYGALPIPEFGSVLAKFDRVYLEDLLMRGAFEVVRWQSGDPVFAGLNVIDSSLPGYLYSLPDRNIRESRRYVQLIRSFARCRSVLDEACVLQQVKQ